MKKQSPIRIELTAEQQEQVKQITGKEVPQVRLALEDLEERVAPGMGVN